MWNPLSLFGNKKIDEFSQLLARDLAGIVPLEPAADSGGKKGGRRAEAKFGRELEGVYRRAREFRKEHKLGIYGKARLGNSFKWELKELGYDDEFIEDATRGLIIAMSRS